MILIGRSLDKLKRGSDARQSFLKAPRGIFLTANGRFVFKEGLPNCQGVLKNSAKLSLKGGPILKQVQHCTYIVKPMLLVGGAGFLTAK